jgi:phosphinothricin acetyltransferase
MGDMEGKGRLREGVEPTVHVRAAILADLQKVTAIYNRFVVESHATFDLEPATLESRAEWFDWHGTTGRHRVLVAETDGTVVGFSSSGPLRPRPAYEPSVETSVYVSPDTQGRGIGSRLYEALFDALAHEDVHRAYAGIALPNPPSVWLHERFGFREVGRFSEAGLKFGRYWDVAWFEKRMD